MGHHVLEFFADAPVCGLVDFRHAEKGMMKENYYFDNAATSWPKPESVYTAMDAFHRRFGVNPGRSGYEMGVEAARMVVETRRLLADFFSFSGDPNRVVFAQNASDGLNTVLGGLLDAGDHVITTRTEHNSVLRPLNHFSKDRGVAVSHARHDSVGYVDPDDIRRMIRPQTKVIVVNHASNVLGSVQDIRSIGRIARAHGIVFVLDTCQTAGVVPIDMEADFVDVLVFTGHKGLFGPMGSGGAIVGDGVTVRPTRFGGTGTDSISPLQPEDYPHRLETGTLAIPCIAGLNAAQKWFADLGAKVLRRDATGLSHRTLAHHAVTKIREVEHQTLMALDTAFRTIGGVTMHGPPADRPRVATLSLSIGDLQAETVGTMLDADHAVCVRAGLHCAPLIHEDAGTIEAGGTVRFAPGFFTDDEDVEQAIAGVEAIAAYATRRLAPTRQYGT